MSIDCETAKRRLTNRWHEQCERFPTMRNEITLERYVQVNLAYVMRYGLLSSYEMRP